MTEKIEIHTDTIQLGQFLKWAGIIDSGGQTKYFLDNKSIKINGIVITEKRKKIVVGDIIEVKDIGIWQIVHEN